MRHTLNVLTLATLFLNACASHAASTAAPSATPEQSATSAPVAQATTKRCQLVQPIAPAPSVATAINDNGDVTGASNGVAFRWSDGVLTRIGTLPWDSDTPPTSIGYGINTSGIVVGASGTYEQETSAPDRQSQGFIYPQPNLKALFSDDTRTVRSSPSEAAMAINDANVIVGNDGSAAFVSIPDMPEDVGTDLESDSFHRSIATAIDSRGEVVGASSLRQRSNELHPYLWARTSRNPTPVDLGLPHGYHAGIATGIANGMIVGYTSTTPDLTSGWLRSPQTADFVGLPYTGVAWRWYNSSMQTLASRHGARHSAALGTGDVGAIVGTSDNHAMLWRDTLALDLNDWLGRQHAWTLQVARGINRRGWIVGNGLFNGAPTAFLFHLCP